MDENTKRELIQNGSGLVGKLLKEMMEHRNRINVLEEKKDAELELARTKMEHEEVGAGSTVDAATDTAETQRRPEDGDVEGQVGATPAEIEEALDELIEEEMCDVCQELLIALKERPPKEQVRGVMEYGTFKRNLSDRAGVEELKETIRETEVLHDIFRQNFAGGGAGA